MWALLSWVNYAIVQPALDDKPLGTTVVLEHEVGELAAGTHQVTLKITGTNPNAVQNCFTGLDCLRLVKKP